MGKAIPVSRWLQTFRRHLGRPRDLNDLAAECHQNSADHGFWDFLDDDNVEDLDDAFVGLRQPRTSREVEKRSSAVLMKLMLLVTEVAEAAEEVRKNQMTERFREVFGEEMADVIIRALDLTEALGINIESAVNKKMAANRARPPMHGKLA